MVLIGVGGGGWDVGERGGGGGGGGLLKVTREQRDISRGLTQEMFPASVVPKTGPYFPRIR